jgi:hypothetical protein
MNESETPNFSPQTMELHRAELELG